MRITIDFRHPQSFERIALIERETLNGKQARRVMEAVETEQRHITLEGIYARGMRSVKLIAEQFKLENVHKRYAIRRYDRKPLDQLTSYEVAQMNKTDRELYEWCMTPIDKRQ